MYIRKTNHKIRPTRTPDEKEKIVLLYLNHEMGVRQIVRYRWVRQYKQFGNCLETRGKATKLNNPNKGRPRKYPERTLEEYSKEELIMRVRMLEDIKKSLVYLESQNQNKNIK